MYGKLQISLDEIVDIIDLESAKYLIQKTINEKSIGALWWWFGNNPRFGLFYKDNYGILYDNNNCIYSKGIMVEGNFLLENGELATFDFPCAINLTTAIDYFSLLPKNIIIDGLIWE